MPNQLLLLEDVDNLGRSGEVVTVKPGFARNFLLPQKKAVVADKFTLRLQSKLKEERFKRAEKDRQDAEELSKRLEGMTLTTVVKVDPDGHMYGSVAAVDIVRLFEEQGITIERRNVALVQPIKALGIYPIHLKLKEGIPAEVILKVVSDGAPEEPVEETPAVTE